MDSVAVLIRREEKVLLVKNEDSETWSPVMSEVERGETFREAARRHTTSVVDADIDFVEKVDREDVPGGERIHWYLATEKSPTDEDENPDHVDIEDRSMGWFRPEEIEDLDVEKVSEKFFSEFTSSLVD